MPERNGIADNSGYTCYYADYFPNKGSAKSGNNYSCYRKGDKQYGFK